MENRKRKYQKPINPKELAPLQVCHSSRVLQSLLNPHTKLLLYFQWHEWIPYLLLQLSQSHLQCLSPLHYASLLSYATTSSPPLLAPPPSVVMSPTSVSSHRPLRVVQCTILSKQSAAGGWRTTVDQEMEAWWPLSKMAPAMAEMGGFFALSFTRRLWTHIWLTHYPCCLDGLCLMLEMVWSRCIGESCK